MADMTSRSERPETMGAVPEPEVTAKAKRRRFSAEYKLRVLREADALAESGGVGERAIVKFGVWIDSGGSPA